MKLKYINYKFKGAKQWVYIIWKKPLNENVIWNLKLDIFDTKKVVCEIKSYAKKNISKPLIHFQNYFSTFIWLCGVKKGQFKVVRHKPK